MQSATAGAFLLSLFVKEEIMVATQRTESMIVSRLSATKMQAGYGCICSAEPEPAELSESSRQQGAGRGAILEGIAHLAWQI